MNLSFAIQEPKLFLISIACLCIFAVWAICFVSILTVQKGAVTSFPDEFCLGFYQKPGARGGTLAVTVWSWHHSVSTWTLQKKEII